MRAQFEGVSSNQVVAIDDTRANDRLHIKVKLSDQSTEIGLSPNTALALADAIKHAVATLKKRR